MYDKLKNIMIKKQKNNITAQDLNCRKNRYIKNLEGEIWKSLEDYPNYIISNMGRVFSIEKKRVLKPYVCPDKQNPKKVLYPTLKLKNRWGKFDNVFLHKVVAIAFVENTENKPQIHHKDKNPLN